MANWPGVTELPLFAILSIEVLLFCAAVATPLERMMSPGSTGGI